MKKNIDVQEYVMLIQQGDEKKKVELFQEKITPFFHAYLTDRYMRELKKDATQNLWEEYVRAINNYTFEHKMTFLSYIQAYYFIKAIQKTLKDKNEISNYLKERYTFEFEQAEFCNLEASGDSKKEDDETIRYIKEVLYNNSKKPNRIDIYFKYHLEEKTLKELGEEYNYTSERVRQIINEIHSMAQTIANNHLNN